MRWFLIDTDAGIDDSIAIMMAHAAEDVEIVAITTVFGTATLENTTRNVLDVSEHIGLNTRIARGSARPLVLPQSAPGDFHGPTGIGLAHFPRAAREPEATAAWDVMYQEAAKRPGELTVVTLGPLTNLALAFLKYPELPGMLKEVVIMGGSACTGNVSAFSEANVYNDPHACEVVLRSGARLVMVGLNATEQARLTTRETNRIFSTRTIVHPMLDKMLETYKFSQNRSGETGMLINDGVAMAVALDPGCAQTRRMHVVCETAQSPMMGRTVADFRPFADGEPNVDVVMTVDRERYKALLVRTVEFLKL